MDPAYTLQPSLYIQKGRGSYPKRSFCQGVDLWCGMTQSNEEDGTPEELALAGWMYGGILELLKELARDPEPASDEIDRFGGTVSE